MGLRVSWGGFAPTAPVGCTGRALPPQVEGMFSWKPRPFWATAVMQGDGLRQCTAPDTLSRPPTGPDPGVQCGVRHDQMSNPSRHEAGAEALRMRDPAQKAAADLPRAVYPDTL